MRIFFSALLGLMSCLMVLPAGAGGVDENPGDETGKEGPAFFGFVREERGPNVGRATVTVQPKTGNAVNVQANIMGVYRTHVSPTAKAEDVTITCSKAGYKQTRVVRRTSTSGRVVETDCMMQKL
jgi:hypothetical protein